MPPSLRWFFVVSLCPGSFPIGCIVVPSTRSLGHFLWAHYSRLEGCLSTTINFVFSMLILRPIRLLSSDSSCSICCSSCGISVHMNNMSSAKRRLERNFPSIFTPLFSQFKLLNRLSNVVQQVSYLGDVPQVEVRPAAQRVYVTPHGECLIQLSSNVPHHWNRLDLAVSNLDMGDVNLWVVVHRTDDHDLSLCIVQLKLVLAHPGTHLVDTSLNPLSC